MEKDEKREQVIQGLADMLRTTTFSIEFKVKKKPKGIKVVIEVTQDRLNELLKEQQN